MIYIICYIWRNNESNFNSYNKVYLLLFSISKMVQTSHNLSSRKMEKTISFGLFLYGFKIKLGMNHPNIHKCSFFWEVIISTNLINLVPINNDIDDGKFFIFSDIHNFLLYYA